MTLKVKNDEEDESFKDETQSLNLTLLDNSRSLLRM